MATTLSDVVDARPEDTEPVSGLPLIFRKIIDYLQDAVDIDSGAVVQTPVGVIQGFGGTVVPTGWLLCNGATYSHEDYPELWSTIGTNFGGTSSTSFKVPDLQRRVPIGAGGTKLFTAVTDSDYDDGGQDADEEVDTDLGSYGGSEVHTIKRLELPADGIAAGPRSDESTGAPFGDHDTYTITRVAGKESTAKMPLSEDLGAGVSFSLLPPSVTVNFIIKALP